MRHFSEARERIYEFFHASAACRSHFEDPSHESEYAAYYNSMYLLQDTCESLWHHRDKGFSKRARVAYIEFWGVMQAVIIQQDAALELVWALTGSRPSWANGSNALELRNLRNTCAGHPALQDRRKGQPIARSFMPRSFGSYDSVSYEIWQQGKGTSHSSAPLGALLDAYDMEAAGMLDAALRVASAKWSS